MMYLSCLSESSVLLIIYTFPPHFSPPSPFSPSLHSPSPLISPLLLNPFSYYSLYSFLRIDSFRQLCSLFYIDCALFLFTHIIPKRTGYTKLLIRHNITTQIVPIAFFRRFSIINPRINQLTNQLVFNAGTFGADGACFWRRNWITWRLKRCFYAQRLTSNRFRWITWRLKRCF